MIPPLRNMKERNKKETTEYSTNSKFTKFKLPLQILEISNFYHVVLKPPSNKVINKSPKRKLFTTILINKSPRENVAPLGFTNGSYRD